MVAKIRKLGLSCGFMLYKLANFKRIFEEVMISTLDMGDKLKINKEGEIVI